MSSLLSFLVGYLLSRLSAPFFAARNRKSGHLDAPGGRKDQPEPVPFGGGTALVASVLGGLAFGVLGLEFGVERFEIDPEGVAKVAPRLLAILAGALMLAMMGRIDDRRGLSVSLRLAIQFVAASGVAISGTRLGLYLESSLLQSLVTVVFIVFVTNAFNFIDNMDGLACGSGLASALGIAIIAGLDEQLFVSSFAALLAGALFGVLAHNAQPARLYLGDEGSLFAGFLLASLAVLVSYRSERGLETPEYFPFLIPILVLGVPLLDGIFVCIARPLRGVSPWTAGRDHLSHRLARFWGRLRGGEEADNLAAVRALTLLAFLAVTVAPLLYSLEARGLRSAGLLLTTGILIAFMGRRSR
jgi:UDP-GlcNAc:undecaprenyl-phosphate/decaprenyl-phosphate GlcNAc-1-phosphate transferase